MNQDEKNLLEEALKYVDHGYWIFPCENKGGKTYYSKKLKKVVELKVKTPLMTNGFKDATNDKSQVEKWWGKKYIGQMIGCDLGRSNLWVIDIDNHKVDGFKHWSSLNISDEGTLKVLTPNKGLHLYFRGHAPTKSQDTIGVDFRGVGGYSVLPHSYILKDDGTKLRYTALTDMFSEPRPVSNDILDKLGLVKKERKKRNSSIVSTLSLDDELQKIKYILDHLPQEYLEDYSKWLEVGLSLRKFGDLGFRLWEKWTEERYFVHNPKSKRINFLEYKWQSFAHRDDEITIATLYHNASKEGVKWTMKMLNNSN